MDNRTVADIFLSIADILEVKGENIFRVRAYRTAALNLKAMAERVEDIAKNNPDELSKIEGIGKDLKDKILEILKTGRLKYHDDLIKEFPQGFFDMLSLSGMGPKRLAKLRDEFGIANIDDLEKAAKAGKVSKIEGLGEKVEQNLLSSIELYKKHKDRALIQEAEVIANHIIAYLKKSKLFTRIEKAGSLRRGLETIGDIDILASSKHHDKAMGYFASYPGLEKIIAKGPTKTSLLLKGEMQVDLRIVDDSSFGAALQYFTGSKAHNVKLRTLAKNRGLKVNEYGVFEISSSGKDEDEKEGKLVASKTEEEVYECLGLEWMPPELREDRGEIEAAKDSKLPRNLITLKHIKGDLHVHSTASDGRNSIEEMAERAKELGHEYLAFCDHSQLIKIAHGLDETRLLRHADNIRKISSRLKGITLLAGVEVDILKDGKLDIADSVLRELDVVVAAIHSNFSLEMEEQTARILKALDNKYVNILAHPTGRLITRRSPMEIDFERIFKHAQENKVHMEINTHGDRVDLNDILARRAKKSDLKFSIDSDSHGVESLETIRYGVTSARRAWLEKDDVINTYSLEDLRKLLRR
ncbi:MAG: DNA polymerase/3'-5' exonuclease PolX [Candidatus Omnitrophica bacterium]|nr:DNA polymerase/3'-5' exonuclease PolX [Candidatus Omnitrophota bacterium]